MITITNLSKAFGGQVLFEDANLQLTEGNRYGIVGANGSGKSTLLKIMTGEVESSTGDVAMPKRVTVGTLSQDHFKYEDTPIINVVMQGNEILWNAMVEKEAVLANAHEHFDAERYTVLEDLILQHDGYSLEARSAEILAGLNIPDDTHRQPLKVLSGGYKLRALLAQVLAGQPDVLLLDEPTNHLDILSIAWLETFLGKYKGCAVVVSHDHRFLDTVCSHIIDVDYQAVTLYKGNFGDFEKAKKEERERRQIEIDRREKEIEDRQAFIDRFKAKASKARQAQSRVKQIEKIVVEELPQTSRRFPKFKFPQRRPSGKTVLDVIGVSKAYGDNVVLLDVGFTVQRGDRVAVLGPNGIGKSTLLKIAMGLLDADDGRVEWGYETHPGYFAQDHRDLLGTEGSGTIESWLWDRTPQAPIGLIRGKLAEVLFQRDEVHKKLTNLSGGEAARLIFCGLGVDAPNVLVLDEPTNHLDMEGIEALAQALEAYEGTLLFVSHDRWFVSRLATRIIALSEDGLDDFRGTYDEFLRKTRAIDHLDQSEVIAKAKSKRSQKKGQSNNNDQQKRKKGKGKRPGSR